MLPAMRETDLVDRSAAGCRSSSALAGDDETGRAEAALRGAAAHELVLQRVQSSLAGWMPSMVTMSLPCASTASTRHEHTGCRRSAPCTSRTRRRRSPSWCRSGRLRCAARRAGCGAHRRRCRVPRRSGSSSRRDVMSPPSRPVRSRGASARRPSARRYSALPRTSPIGRAFVHRAAGGGLDVRRQSTRRPRSSASAARARSGVGATAASTMRSSAQRSPVARQADRDADGGQFHLHAAAVLQVDLAGVRRRRRHEQLHGRSRRAPAACGPARCRSPRAPACACRRHRAVRCAPGRRSAAAACRPTAMRGTRCRPRWRGCAPGSTRSASPPGSARRISRAPAPRSRVHASWPAHRCSNPHRHRRPGRRRPRIFLMLITCAGRRTCSRICTSRSVPPASTAGLAGASAAAAPRPRRAWRARSSRIASWRPCSHRADHR